MINTAYASYLKKIEHMFLLEISGNIFNQRKVYLEFLAKWPMKDKILKIHNRLLIADHFANIFVDKINVTNTDVASDKISFNMLRKIWLSH